MAYLETLPSLLKYVKANGKEALAIKLHLCPDRSDQYTWFTDKYMQEILSESYAVMKKVQVSKDKEAFFFTRSGNVRILFHVKSSDETSGHVLSLPPAAWFAYSLPVYGFINVNGRKVFPFLNGHNTPAGERYTPYRIMPRQLCVYLDCYDLASEDGVVKVRQVLDSSWSDGGDIVSLFDSKASSAITSYPLKKSKADEKTSLKSPDKTDSKKRLVSSGGCVFGGGRVTDHSQRTITSVFPKSSSKGGGGAVNSVNPISLSSSHSDSASSSPSPSTTPLSSLVSCHGDSVMTKQNKKTSKPSALCKDNVVPDDVLSSFGSLSPSPGAWIGRKDRPAANTRKTLKRPKRGNKEKRKEGEWKTKRAKLEEVEEEERDDVVIIKADNSKKKKTRNNVTNNAGSISLMERVLATTNRLDKLDELMSTSEPVIEMTEEMKRLRARVRGEKEVFTISSDEEEEIEKEDNRKEEEEKKEVIDEWRLSKRSTPELQELHKKLFSSFHDINELTEPVLKKWLKSRKKTLCDIMTNQVMEYLLYSKIPSERHDKFKAGRKEKSDLQYEICTTMLTQEQTKVITDTLHFFFCSKTTELFSYMWLVLYPEAIIQLIMDFHSLNYNEAEHKMYHYYPVKTEVNLDDI